MSPCPVRALDPQDLPSSGQEWWALTLIDKKKKILFNLVKVFKCSLFYIYISGSQDAQWRGDAGEWRCYLQPSQPQTCRNLQVNTGSISFNFIHDNFFFSSLQLQVYCQQRPWRWCQQGDGSDCEISPWGGSFRGLCAQEGGRWGRACVLCPRLSNRHCKNLPIQQSCINWLLSCCQVTWTKGGSPVTSRERVKIANRGGRHSLTIQKVRITSMLGPNEAQTRNSKNKVSFFLGGACGLWRIFLPCF